MQKNYKKQSEPNDSLKTGETNPVNSRIPNKKMPWVESENFGIDRMRKRFKNEQY